MQGASLGYELLAHVFAHLDILETDYFGLQYTDEKSVTRWIDQDKSIKKQTCKQRGIEKFSLFTIYCSCSLAFLPYVSYWLTVYCNNKAPKICRD